MYILLHSSSACMTLEFLLILRDHQRILCDYQMPNHVGGKPLVMRRRNSEKVFGEKGITLRTARSCQMDHSHWMMFLSKWQLNLKVLLLSLRVPGGPISSFFNTSLYLTTCIYIFRFTKQGSRLAQKLNLT